MNKTSPSCRFRDMCYFRTIINNNCIKASNVLSIRTRRRGFLKKRRLSESFFVTKCTCVIVQYLLTRNKTVTLEQEFEEPVGNVFLFRTGRCGFF